MQNYKRVKESEIVTRPGYFPARVVLGKHHVGQEHEAYCTHIEVLPVDRDDFLISGHYDLSEEEAEKDFTKRITSL